jgi:hypothetical protein
VCAAATAVATAIGSAPSVMPPTQSTSPGTNSRTAVPTATAPSPENVVCRASMYHDDFSPDRSVNGPSVLTECAVKCSKSWAFAGEKEFKKISQVARIPADTVVRQDAFLTSRLSPNRGRRKAALCSFAKPSGRDPTSKCGHRVIVSFQIRVLPLWGTRIPGYRSLSSRPPFREGRRACEPGGAASPRAWRSWRHRPGCRLKTVNCELKTLWINFVVAGSPAPLHRRCAPLPSPLKVGRDSPFIAHSLRASLQGGQASLRAGWGCEPASLEELDGRTM